MKSLKFSIAILFAFYCSPIQLLAQDKPTIPINTVVERAQKLFQVYPIEKVHVHFDKPYYAVGDTLWFKTYLNRNLFEYDPSKIAYVEVLNSKDSLIQTFRLPLKDGVGNGHFVLDPQFMVKDNYRFRAYTKWMGNFDPAYFFNKIVPIGDAINNKLITHVEFKPNENGNKTQVMVQFKDKTGNILSRTKLNWEAISGWETIGKGKGETDDMGRVTMNISAKDKEMLQNGLLTVKVGGEKGESALVGDFSLKNAIWDADVQFFPEGGELIAGLAKNIAFKAVGANGKGLKITGRIVDAKNVTVVEFKDQTMGMGVFSMLPIANEKYKAIVKFDNGQERSYALPNTKEDAVNVVLHKQADSTIQIGIVTNDTYFKKVENQPFYILAVSNGQLCYAAQATLKNPSFLLSIPKDRFPNGIAQITLMKPDGTPISERLIFVEAESLLDIKVQTDKDTYRPKDPVKLTLNVSNNGQKTSGSYSVAVVDESKVPYDDNQELTIVNNFLLTSDLKGYIENPNYYFNTKNVDRLEALDVLLMTQGFRRFSYPDILAEKLPQLNFLPEQGISLSGVLRLNTGRTVENAGLLLKIPAAGVNKDAYTDANGKFVFENLVFPDSSKVTVNARSNANYRSLVINMDQSYFPGIDKNNPYLNNIVENIDQVFAPYLDNSRKEYRKSILLDEVVVTGVVKKVQTNKDFSSLSGLSMPEHRIEASRLSGCTVLTMCLNTVLTGITYDSQTLKYYVSRDYNAGGRIPVQFFLNGMPIDEPSLNSINVPDIEGIEIFLRDELGTVSRMYQNNGVVSIYTKKVEKQPRMSLAQIESMLPKTNIIDMYPLGYIKERTFYTPKYDTPERKATNDLRTTIYWNPNVAITETGELALDFYNADGNGKYKVVVEGMDQTGNIGRQVLEYQVK
ncbi:carboxypeptidase-like regulatory domain-containing protein [Sphingobacterium sp. SYP-B4668]|uniref:carboxypeptidase-like regulatory domain-containing protein n=1 Tax=Sphingobacterium sp. SYP-B4668 TaxID=2996035 RepID=UPI0022DD60A0|nr:carboxypeptidase-like regulatory domain-containing protein [Sphingobacterium sp. SYP-B4668]